MNSVQQQQQQQQLLQLPDISASNLPALNSTSVDYVIEQLISFQGTASRPLVNEFTMEFVMMLLDKDKLTFIEAQFKAYPRDGVDIVEFVKIFLSAISHKPHELIYLTIAIIDLFKAISETLSLQLTLSFSSLTSFLCDYFLEKNIQTYQLQTVRMPEQRKFQQPAATTTTAITTVAPSKKETEDATRQIRAIDLEPTLVHGRTDDLLKRLLPNSVLTDSSKHNNHCITSGVYSRADNQVITLDSLGTEVKFYKLTNKLDRVIATSPDKSKQTIVMSFAYSQREQRIGATLKDISLVFWDKIDSYKFQKRFNVSGQVCDYQKQIWYLESAKQWVTTDKTNALHIWNIDEERVLQSITSPFINQAIICIEELTHIHLTAIASLDKHITVWDLVKETLHFKIDLSAAGVHHFVYSYAHQSIITAGFENQLRVFTVSAKHLDADFGGYLRGHTSMVTAVQTIERTPMVISSDDLGFIRVWDIRSLSCIQTISIGYRTTMTSILSIPEADMICLLGTRVNFIRFDSSNAQDSLAKLKLPEDIFPIKVEYNPKREELAVCTRKDIRFIRIADGKVDRILTGLLPSTTDEITTFGFMNQFQNFILGDQHGNLSVYNGHTGEFLKTFAIHTNEVSGLLFDNSNKLLISSSMDSSLAITEWVCQSATPSANDLEFIQKRRILNAHVKKPINQICVSFYHNIIVTTSAESYLYVYDFEFVKLIGCIQIDKGSEPTGIIVLNSYQVMLVATNVGKIYVMKFHAAEFKVAVEMIAMIDINDSGSVAASSGDEVIEASQMKRKTTRGKSMDEDELIGDDDELYVGVVQQEWCTKIVEEIEENAQRILKKITVLASTNKGRVIVISIDVEEENVKYVEHSNVRVNYNAKRTYTEDFLTTYAVVQNEKTTVKAMLKKRKMTAETTKIEVLRQFSAHKDMLTTLNFIELNGKCLVTSASDGYVRIWTKEGKLKANVNVSHPLPVVWQITQDPYATLKQRMFYAMKVIDVIRLKYRKKEVTVLVNNIDEFLATLLPGNGDRRISDSAIEETVKISKSKRDEVEEKRMKKVQTMKDEFTPRDIKFNDVEKIYANELRGISLKQMEARKRLREMAEEQMNFSSKHPVESSYKANDVIKQKKQQEIEIIQFFSENWRNRLKSNLQNDSNGGGGNVLLENTEANKQTALLKRKLDAKARELQQRNSMNGNNVIPKTQQFIDVPTSSLSLDPQQKTPLPTLKTQLSIYPKPSITSSSSPMPTQRNIRMDKVKSNTTIAAGAANNIATTTTATRTIDFIDYAINKNYLNDSQTVGGGGGATFPTDASSILSMDSTRRSIKRLETTIATNSNNNNTSNDNNSAIGMNTSAVNSSVTPAQYKVQMSDVLKNINEKLKKSKYNQDSSMLARLQQHQQQQRNALGILNTEDDSANMTMIDHNQSSSALFFKINNPLNSSNIQRSSVKKSQHLTFLDGIINDDILMKGAQTERQTASTVALKLPLIQPVQLEQTNKQPQLQQQLQQKLRSGTLKKAQVFSQSCKRLHKHNNVNEQ